MPITKEGRVGKATVRLGTTAIGDLGPQDMIDVQSFMWTSVEYTEDDRADYEEKADT